MRTLQSAVLTAAVLGHVVMLGACQPDDMLRPSARSVSARPNSVLDGDAGNLGISSPTNPAETDTLTTYPYRTAVAIRLSGLISMDSYNTGSIYHTYYSHYDGNLNGRGVKAGSGECYAFVDVRYGFVVRSPGGGCLYTPNQDTATVWEDTAIVIGPGAVSRFPGVPLAAHEVENGCDDGLGNLRACYLYSGSQSYSVKRVLADLSLTGVAAVRPGIAFTDSGKVGPAWVKGQKIPFEVQSWRYYPGDSVINAPYSSLLLSACVPPSADTNPAPCSFNIAANSFGVIELEARVNGVVATARKNHTVSDSARACEGQVVKVWRRISSRYQVREAIRAGKPHRGFDQATAEGTPLYAAEAGRVKDTGTGRTSGIRVVVLGAHYSYYFHLQSRTPGLTVGDSVSANQLLGYSGHTGVDRFGNPLGPHLHFQQHRPSQGMWNKDGLPPPDMEREPCYY